MNFSGSLEMSKSRSRIEADNALCKLLANQRSGYIDNDFQTGSNLPEFSLLAPFPQLSRSSQTDPQNEELSSKKQSPAEFKQQVLHPPSSFSAHKINPIFEEKPTIYPSNGKSNFFGERESINLIPSPSFELPHISYSNFALNSLSNIPKNSLGNLSTHQLSQFSPVVPSNQSSLHKHVEEKIQPESQPKKFNKKQNCSDLDKKSKKMTNPSTPQPFNSSKATKYSLQDRKKTGKLSEGSNSESDSDSEASGPLNHLSTLSSVLRKFFKEEEVLPEDLNLSYAEKVLLCGIVERKFGEKVLGDLPEEMFSSLKDILSSEGNKRPEEYYKFAFKQIVKSMRKEFRNQVKSKVRYRKDPTEKAFYVHYFGEICTKTGEEIDRFYQPRTGKNPLIPKTFNSTYIRRVGQSQPFMDDFRRHLNSLLPQSTNLIDSKINRLVRRLDSIIEESLIPAEEIVESVINSRKCKLPWTLTEVRKATTTVEKFLNTYLA